MKVKSVAFIHLEGIVAEPGDVFDLPDDVAADFINHGFVKKFKYPKPKQAAVELAVVEPEPEPQQDEPDEEETADEDAPIETEMLEGAPEIAVSRRGRRRRRRRIIEPR